MVVIDGIDEAKYYRHYYRSYQRYCTIALEVRQRHGMFKADLAVLRTMKKPFQPLNTQVILRSGMPARDLKKVTGSDDLVQVRVLSPASIFAGRVLQVETPLIALPREVVARHALKEGNVVVSARGEFVAGLVDGNPTKLTGGVPLLAGPLCHTLTCERKGGEGLSPQFLAWLLGTEYARQHMAAASRGSAISLYNLETVGSLQVPLLPIAEQVAIAEASSAARILRQARLALAETEAETNNAELCRHVGIRA